MDYGMLMEVKSLFLKEMQKFSNFLFEFNEPLPEKIIDGVCLLTDGQDQWSVALSTFLLAKQAGLDIEFQHANQPLKDSKLYFLPSVNGASVISRRRMQELLKKVQEGAMLYISNDDGHIGPFFLQIAGVNVIYCQKQGVDDLVLFIDSKIKYSAKIGEEVCFES